jgi:hypothetical protein
MLPDYITHVYCFVDEAAFIDYDRYSCDDCADIEKNMVE